MSKENRTQEFADGTTLAVPESRRFRWDAAVQSWCWVRDDGFEVWSFEFLRERMPQEWQSCCAVAAALYRVERERTMHAVVDAVRSKDYECPAARACDMWQAEFALRHHNKEPNNRAQ